MSCKLAGKRACEADRQCKHRITNGRQTVKTQGRIRQWKNRTQGRQTVETQNTRQPDRGNINQGKADSGNTEQQKQTDSGNIEQERADSGNIEQEKADILETWNNSMQTDCGNIEQQRRQTVETQNNRNGNTEQQKTDR